MSRFDTRPIRPAVQTAGPLLVYASLNHGFLRTRAQAPYKTIYSKLSPKRNGTKRTLLARSKTGYGPGRADRVPADALIFCKRPFDCLEPSLDELQVIRLRDRFPAPSPYHGGLMHKRSTLGVVIHPRA